MHVEVRLLQESTEQLQRRCDEAQLLLEEHEHRHRSTVEALKEEVRVRVQPRRAPIHTSGTTDLYEWHHQKGIKKILGCLH